MGTRREIAFVRIAFGIIADQLVGPGIATLRCTNNGFGNLSIATFNINAIKLGTLTFQP